MLNTALSLSPPAARAESIESFYKGKTITIVVSTGGGVMSPERAQRCNQIWLDPILCERAGSFKSTRLRFRWRFEEPRQEDGRVLAIVHDLARDERRRIAAQYLIDCGGGHSLIRRALAIPMSGSPYMGYHLSLTLADFRGVLSGVEFGTLDHSRRFRARSQA